MKLSTAEFDRLKTTNRLVLSFIGMSNIGKSYWGRQLTKVGFDNLCVDDLIETQLAELLKQTSHSGIRGVSAWMGQPYEKKFGPNQQKYLELEKTIMTDILSQARAGKLPNSTIDTTGSVVHLGPKLCEELKKYSLVIYFEAEPTATEKMYENYFKQPKPVAFAEFYKPKAGETQTQSLRRCYQLLMQYRARQYRHNSDIIIPRSAIARSATPDQFITLIKQAI